MKTTQTFLTLACAFSGLLGLSAQAQNTPILGSGYNYNGIIEGAPTTGAGLAADITASVNGESLDGRYSYFAQGLDSANPTSGFVVGTPFTSAANSNTSFEILPDTAATPNIFIDQSHGGPTTGTFTLAAPTGYSTLALLVTGFNNGQTGNYVLNFADGTMQTGTFTAPDNYDSTQSSIATGANERVDVTSGSFANEGYNGGPFLFEDDITVTDTSALTSIVLGGSSTFSGNSGNPGYAVFAISGDAITAPEPGTYALMALGLGALVLVARRRLAA